MIYLVRAEETNLYKIGYTSSTAESRIKTMQTGCPHKLSIVLEVDGSVQKEKKLHKTFSKNQKQGEWFEFNEEALEGVCEELKKKEPKQSRMDTSEYRDMYERFIRETGSCDHSLEDFIYVAILEVMLGNYDTAIQRLREFQVLIYGGSYLKCIPPLTERILNSGIDHKGE